MKGIKEMIPSSADFHYPLDWFGKGLSGFSRTHFETLKHGIEVYIADPKDSSKLINILNLVEETKIVGITESIPILSEIVKYIRVHLLSKDPEKVFHTLVLCDCLVKNSGYRVHLMIGRRKFMKTIGLITRRNRKVECSQNISHLRVAILGLDCIQAWGEAFTSRRVLYPHIYETYYKMRHKYNIVYPRIDFDPTRVTISLGPVTEREKQLIREYPAEYDSDTSSTVPSEAEATIAKDYVRSNPNTVSSEEVHSYDVIDNLTTCTSGGAHNPPASLSAKSAEDGTTILTDVRYNPSPIATTAAAGVASTSDIHFNADTQWRIDDYSHLEPSYLKESQSSGSHRDLSGALVYDDDGGVDRNNNLPEPPKKRHNMYMITIQSMNTNTPIKIEGATNLYDNYQPAQRNSATTVSGVAISASTAAATAIMTSPSLASRQRSHSNSSSPAYAEPWYAQRPPTPPATPGGSHSKSSTATTSTAVDKPANLVPLLQGFYYGADQQDSIFEPPFSAPYSSYSGQQVAQAGGFRPSPKLPSPKHLRSGSSASGTPTHSVLPTIADTMTEMEEDSAAPVSNSGGGANNPSVTTDTQAAIASASAAGGVFTINASDTMAQYKIQKQRDGDEEEGGADTPKERGEYIPQEFTDPTAEYHDNSISLTDSIAMANIVMSPRNSNISDRNSDSDKSVSVFSQFSTTAVAGGSAAGDVTTTELNRTENPTAASADDENYDDYTNNHTFTDLDSKITEILHNEQHHAPLPLSMPVPQRTTSLNTGMNLIHISEGGGAEDDGGHSATGSFDHKKSTVSHPVAMLNVLSEHHPPHERTSATEHHSSPVPDDDFITPVEIVPVSSRAAESLLEAVNSPFSSPCFAGVVPGVYESVTADQQRNSHNKRGRDSSRNTVPCGNTVPFATLSNNEEEEREEEECMQQDSSTAGDGANINIGGNGGNDKSSDRNNDNIKLRQKRAKGL